MERLTERDLDCGYYVDESFVDKVIYSNINNSRGIQGDAIDRLAEYENLMEEYGLKDLTEIESAVQKQMPKQVILENAGAKRCPTCGVKHFNPSWMAEYCEDCGQKLDWR